MNKTTVDIGYGDLDIYVDGQLALHIGQVSDDKIINLFIYPKGDIVKSILSEENPDSECTHEILIPRKIV
jgi:hypothetical protein